MESNNRFLQELPSESSAIAESELGNSTDRELNDLELDAIAGGIRTIPTITASGPKPDFMRHGLRMQITPEFLRTLKSISSREIGK